MKLIRFTKHALLQCLERGTNEIEVTEAILNGSQKQAKQTTKYNPTINKKQIKSKPSKADLNIVTTFSLMENGKGAPILLNEFHQSLPKARRRL